MPFCINCQNGSRKGKHVAKEIDVLKRTQLWVRVFWPGFLMTRFVVYAFVDSPSHFLFWASGRTLHAIFYLLAATMVAVTLGQTPRKILELKALMIWFVAFCSVVADLSINIESSSSRWNSSISWAGLIVANQMVIRLRLSILDERGRG
jgi:hypothetical protein